MPAIAISIFSFLGSIGVRLAGKGFAILAKVEAWLWALIFIGAGLSAVAYDFLYWVLNPENIKLSYTGLDNPIIKAGFGITQSFVNMALVLVLIYVALAIALRLAKETEAKKLLAKFILVALLTNFAPVLCGLVVDAANIVMKEFTKPILASPLAAAGFFEKSKAAIDKLGWIIGGFREETIARELTLAVLIIIFNFLLAFVFFMFGGILILRYLAIWVLVILAPLAFVCIIIPQTQQYWKLWRDNFLKWAFIGVPITFFLYLALYFTSITEEAFKPIATLPVGDLLIYSVPLVFLYLALSMGTKSGAWGAAAAVGFGGALLKKGMAWGKAKGLPALKRGAKYAGQRALETPAVEAISRKLEAMPLAGRLIGGPGATARRREERLVEARKEMEKIPDTPEGNKALLARITRRALTVKDREERVAAIETLAQRKELGNAAAPYLSEFQRLGGNVLLVYKARPDLAQHLTDPTTGKPMTIEQVMKKIEPGEFWKTVQKEALDTTRPGLSPHQINQIHQVILHTILDERKVEQMARHSKRETKQIFRKSLAHFIRAQYKTLPTTQRQKVRKRIRTINSDPRWRV